jgi:hypothetical protein
MMRAGNSGGWGIGGLGGIKDTHLGIMEVFLLICFFVLFACWVGFGWMGVGKLHFILGR